MARPFYKLCTPPASLFAFAPLIVSEYVGVHVEVEKTECVEKLITLNSPTGKSPILETHTGDFIISSQAIARFLATLRRDTHLLGSGSVRESLDIEDWTNWAEQELELPTCVCYYITKGYIPFNEDAFAKGKKHLARALCVLESHFREGSSSDKGRKTQQTYLVNRDYITLADIVVACFLVYPFTLVFDEKFLSSYPMATRWFRTCMKEPEFVAVLGNIECDREIDADGE
mmetsp:Transcript_27333/g.74779  ORF Transcript_27333/g.74779 Transcript_27333/m.74779 type:complete len:230 (+) Transcript_27333:157-846(+)